MGMNFNKHKVSVPGERFYFRGGCFTIRSLILLGFSLQSLSQELLLLGQVLLDKAILAHLLANLHTHTHGNTKQHRCHSQAQ